MRAFEISATAAGCVSNFDTVASHFFSTQVSSLDTDVTESFIVQISQAGNSESVERNTR
jgi:hypothetical protein